MSAARPLTAIPDTAPVIFRDPPPRPATKWGVIVAACQQRPGEWAYVGVFLAKSASNTARRHGLRVTTRTRGDRRTDVYVMWPTTDTTDGAA